VKKAKLKKQNLEYAGHMGSLITQNAFLKVENDGLKAEVKRLEAEVERLERLLDIPPAPSLGLLRAKLKVYRSLHPDCGGDKE
jgi:hypothetical protein